MPIDERVIKVKQHSLDPVRPDRLQAPSRDQSRILEMTQMHEQQLTDTCILARNLINSTLLRHGKGLITTESAVRLSRRVGMPPEFWLGMQPEMAKVFNSGIVATAGPNRKLTRHGLRD